MKQWSKLAYFVDGPPLCCIVSHPHLEFKKCYKPKLVPEKNKMGNERGKSRWYESFLAKAIEHPFYLPLATSFVIIS